MRTGEPEVSELSELRWSGTGGVGGVGGASGAVGVGGAAGGRAAGLGRLSRSQTDARGCCAPAGPGPGPGPGPGSGSGSGSGSGLYYSPPGTSYTIVERPASSQGHRPRGTYLGQAPPGLGVSNSLPAGKKRPISPEQVLRLLGQGGRPQRRGPAPASSPPSTTHHAGYREGRSYLQTSAPNIHELTTRTVTMSRDTPEGTHGFGICVKGGKDAGVGVYISRVEEGSVAERAGLRPGDSILQVNGTPFTAISHDEALKMLKSCRQLSMTVRSPGGSGGAWAGPRQTCSWMDRQGRPVSPPLEYQRAPPPALPPAPRYPPYGGSSRSSSKDRTIRRVDLCIEPGQSLGLMIRGGLEYNLGIFITGVDKDSVADRAGLMIGDQILEVNGQSFLEVTHDEAVNQLKFHKRMSLLVRDVGKVPHSCTAYDHESWDASVGSPPGYGFRHYDGNWCDRRSRSGSCRMPRRSPAAQMVEEKARSLLPNSEFPTLMYYMDEYSGRQMTVEAFVTVLLELLNSSDKYTLMTELREIIAPEDRARFDELVYRRDFSLDHHVRRKGGLENNHHLHHHHMMMSSTMHDLQVPVQDVGEAEVELVGGGPPEGRSPSEDSGLGLPAQDHATRAGAARGGQGRLSAGPVPVPVPVLETDPPPSRQDYCSGDEGEGARSRRHSSPGGSREGSTTALHTANYDDSDQCGYLEGLRSSLGGWTQKVKSWYWGRPLELAHKLSRSFDMKEEGGALLGESGSTMRRHQSMQRLPLGAPEPHPARVIPDHHGNLHITVKKTKPILGIAIEGGANTKHPLPRIINIHENGAAHDAGGLEVGQLILEVDGRRVDGLPHQAVARLIAESFAKRDRQDIEFLVVEAKKSNLEPKPTALIFLEA